MEFGTSIGPLYTCCRTLEFRENWGSNSRTLLKGVHKTFRCFLSFLERRIQFSTDVHSIYSYCAFNEISPQLNPYFAYGSQITIRTFHIYCSILMKFGNGNLHTVLLSAGEYRENRCRLCRAFHMTVDETKFSRKTLWPWRGVCIRHGAHQSIWIQGVSRLVDITAGGDFLGLCDQKSSYKHVCV